MSYLERTHGGWRWTIESCDDIASPAEVAAALSLFLGQPELEAAGPGTCDDCRRDYAIRWHYGHHLELCRACVQPRCKAAQKAAA